MADPIPNLLIDYREVISRLSVLDDPSLYSFTQNEFCKALILSSASYFENHILSLIDKIVSISSKNNELVKAMVKQKVIDRQYHTYFDWKDLRIGSINKFLSLFGETFSTNFKEKLKTDERIHRSVLAFLEIGGLRNQLAHMNYATFPITKTFDEVVLLYEQAKILIEIIDNELMIYVEPENNKMT